MDTSERRHEVDRPDDNPLPTYSEADREEPMPARTPSQAEGDRETIEEDIAEKEAEGKL